MLPYEQRKVSDAFKSMKTWYLPALYDIITCVVSHGSHYGSADR